MVYNRGVPVKEKALDSLYAPVCFDTFCEMLDLDEDYDYFHSNIRGMQQFLNVYKDRMCQDHPPLKFITWLKIMEDFLEVTDEERDFGQTIEPEDIFKMAKKYFKTKFRRFFGKVGYLISHFASPKIKLYRFYETVF